ncbi:MAG: hypothetical protein ACKVW3_14085 [Phycisphaerales bacterium]
MVVVVEDADAVGGFEFAAAGGVEHVGGHPDDEEAAVFVEGGGDGGLDERLGGGEGDGEAGLSFEGGEGAARGEGGRRPGGGRLVGGGDGGAGAVGKEQRDEEQERVDEVSDGEFQDEAPTGGKTLHEQGEEEEIARRQRAGIETGTRRTYGVGRR